MIVLLLSSTRGSEYLAGEHREPKGINYDWMGVLNHLRELEDTNGKLAFDKLIPDWMGGLNSLNIVRPKGINFDWMGELNQVREFEPQFTKIIF